MKSWRVAEQGLDVRVSVRALLACQYAVQVLDVPNLDLFVEQLIHSHRLLNAVRQLALFNRDEFLLRNRHQFELANVIASSRRLFHQDRLDWLHVSQDFEHGAVVDEEFWPVHPPILVHLLQVSIVDHASQVLRDVVLFDGRPQNDLTLVIQTVVT